VRSRLLRVRAWVASEMHETHAKCVRVEISTKFYVISCSHMSQYGNMSWYKGYSTQFWNFRSLQSRNFIERLAWVSYRVPKWKVQIGMAWAVITYHVKTIYVLTYWNIVAALTACQTPSLIPRPFPQPVTKWWHHWTCSLVGVYGFWSSTTWPTR